MSPGIGREGRRFPSYATILLLSRLFQEYSQRGIPPATLVTILGQILIYFRTIPVFWSQSISQSCLSANKIFYYKDYAKLFISQVEHGDDWHLYFNMISFLVKGKHLESRLGTAKYVLMLLVFTGMTGLTYVCLNSVLAKFLDDESYMQTCGVGFSGVIFALKVLTTHDMSQENVQMSLFGLPIGSSVSAKYSVWFELILISLITPNASFLGHLAGILVGLTYVNGPLKLLVDLIYGIFFERRNIPLNVNHSARFTQTNQPSGYRAMGEELPPRRMTSRSQFMSEMSEEEQIRRATEESLRDNLPSSPNSSSSSARRSAQDSLSPSMTVDEMRRRRLNYYNQPT